MSIWIVVFAAMTLLGKTDGKHTGDSLPFWEQACTEDLPNGCYRLVQLKTTYCDDNSAWACNELGIHYRVGGIVVPDTEQAFGFFTQACELKFKAACANLLDNGLALRDVPHELDLRLLLREGGLNLMNESLDDLYARACNHDWIFACAAAGNKNRL